MYWVNKEELRGEKPSARVNYRVKRFGAVYGVCACIYYPRRSLSEANKVNEVLRRNIVSLTLI